jgi:multicomponent K+:H+ antiporter subunit D
MALFAMLLVSGLLSTVALSRAGLRHFWSQRDRAQPRLRIIECLPITLLLFACAVLVVRADPVLRYTRDAAQGLVDPARYIDAVMSAAPTPGTAGAQAAAIGVAQR